MLKQVKDEYKGSFSKVNNPKVLHGFGLKYIRRVGCIQFSKNIYGLVAAKTNINKATSKNRSLSISKSNEWRTLNTQAALPTRNGRAHSDKFVSFTDSLFLSSKPCDAPSDVPPISPSSNQPSSTSPSQFFRAAVSALSSHSADSSSTLAPWKEHLYELRDRALVTAAVAGISLVGCLLFARELSTLLEFPAVSQGVRFLQLAPTEYFFTTIHVAMSSGLLLAAPVAVAQIAGFVNPGLTESERRMITPVVIASGCLFYAGVAFAFLILAPAALGFFVHYAAAGAVESLWVTDLYFDFIFSLLLGTGLVFQLPVLQVALGRTGLVTSGQMLQAWRHVVVAATVMAAVLTPSTDALTQALLTVPIIGLYLGGVATVRLLEREGMVGRGREKETGWMNQINGEGVEGDRREMQWKDQMWSTTNRA